MEGKKGVLSGRTRGKEEGRMDSTAGACLIWQNRYQMGYSAYLVFSDESKKILSGEINAWQMPYRVLKGMKAP